MKPEVREAMARRAARQRELRREKVPAQQVEVLHALVLAGELELSSRNSDRTIACGTAGALARRGLATYEPRTQKVAPTDAGVALIAKLCAAL